MFNKLKKIVLGLNKIEISALRLFSDDKSEVKIKLIKSRLYIYNSKLEKYVPKFYLYDYENVTFYNKIVGNKNIFNVTSKDAMGCYQIMLSPYQSFKLKWMNGDHWVQKISTWGFIITVITSFLLTIQTCSQVKTDKKLLENSNRVTNEIIYNSKK